jgi:hypothetical protein
MARSDSGLLRDVTVELAARSVGSDTLLNILQEQIAEAAGNGRPFTKTGENGLYKRRVELGEELQGIGRDRLERLADELEQKGRIVKALATGTTVKWLDVPDGSFAQGKGTFHAGAGAARSGRKGHRNAAGAAL